MHFAYPDPGPSSLAASFGLAGYLTYRCWLPPNPSPPEPASPLPKDDVGISPSAVQGRRLISLSLWLFHVLLTMLYPSPPAALCPNLDNLSSALFTWSPYTVAVLASIAVAAPIRLVAFRQLGRNFTFRLAEPKKLVVTGLYAHVQHPSYPTNWLVMAANTALLLRLDGVLGCFMPKWVVRWGMGFGLWSAVLIVIQVLGIFAILVRVKDEEVMLKRVFGREWESYNKRTKKFIPKII